MKGGTLMKIFKSLFLIFTFSLLVLTSRDASAASKCIPCHTNVTPGIVQQHLEGKMGKLGFDCSICHGEGHIKGVEDVSLVKMPTPETCAACHKEQVDQFKAGKHNLAWIAASSMPMWHNQPDAVTGTGYRGCSGCHKIGVKRTEEVSKFHYGNAQCDACHTRHSFKKSEAQSSQACSNCHMGFDHPQWEMYMSAKHGIIWDIDGRKADGNAPTCQKCHMTDGNHNVVTSWGFLALRVPTKENVLALIKVAPQLEKQLRSLAAALPSGHFIDVDDDPQWTLDRAIILQAVGVLDANFQPTQRFVDLVVKGRVARGPDEFNKVRSKMKKVCNECHSKNFVNAHFRASDEIIKESDHLFAKAISIVQGLYKDGILKRPDKWEYAPDLLHFYDAKSTIEQDLYLIFLEYRQRAFQGAFHASNDYMHWYGWAPLKETLQRIKDEAARLRAEHTAK
jgi:hypothetical protein